MIKVLLVGSGGREHAIAMALKRNENVKLYAAMFNKNPGIKRLCEKFIVEKRIDKIVDFAREVGVDFVIVGPEDPLVHGIANELERYNIPCVGPKKEVARIEGEKIFARRLMKKYGIPGIVEFKEFDNYHDAEKYLKNYNKEFAIKPSGLTGGKGVRVFGDHFNTIEEALEYIKQIIEKKIGGGRFLIEEKIIGEEFSFQVFTDGKNFVEMPIVQDYKRALENDRGWNTGGMGSYSCEDHKLPFLEEKDIETAREIVRKTLEALYKETGTLYKGILYAQCMADKHGTRLIEFNCRFGDPEAMNVLPILESDFVEICYRIIEGNLSKKHVRFKNLATCCKYIAPIGYGLNPPKPFEVSIDEEGIRNEGAILFYASVNEENGKIYTTTSRTVAVVGIANDLENAERIAENATKYIRGEKLYHRRDIGRNIELKIRRMRELRNLK